MSVIVTSVTIKIQWTTLPPDIVVHLLEYLCNEKHRNAVRMTKIMNNVCRDWRYNGIAKILRRVAVTRISRMWRGIVAIHRLLVWRDKFNDYYADKEYTIDTQICAGCKCGFFFAPDRIYSGAVGKTRFIYFEKIVAFHEKCYQKRIYQFCVTFGQWPPYWRFASRYIIDNEDNEDNDDAVKITDVDKSIDYTIENAAKFVKSEPQKIALLAQLKNTGEFMKDLRNIQKTKAEAYADYRDNWQKSLLQMQ